MYVGGDGGYLPVVDCLFPLSGPCLLGLFDDH